MVGIRSPDGLVVGLAPDTLKFWVRFPNERNQGKTGRHPVLSTGFLKGPIANRFVIGTAVINTHILSGRTWSREVLVSVMGTSGCKLFKASKLCVSKLNDSVPATMNLHQGTLNNSLFF
jgi:hypothetical protein